MTKILSVFQREQKVYEDADSFFEEHPILGYLTAFVGLPMISVAFMVMGVAALMLPAAMICGWL